MSARVRPPPTRPTSIQPTRPSVLVEAVVVVSGAQSAHVGVAGVSRALHARVRRPARVDGRRRNRPARSRRCRHRAPAHPLGTDELGRDELSRLLHGGQVTLLVGFAAMITATVLGLLVGATAGFYRGWTDALLMRLTDTMTAPAFFLIVTAIVVLGPGPLTLILVIGATSWMQVARVIYGETLRFKGRDFVLAADSRSAPGALLLFDTCCRRRYPRWSSRPRWASVSPS